MAQAPPYMFQTMLPVVPGIQQSHPYLQKDPEKEMRQKPNYIYDRFVNNELKFKQEISRI